MEIGEKNLPKPLRDRARERMEAFGRAAGNLGRKWTGDKAVMESAPFVFAVSDFVFNACEQHPEILLDLAGSGDLSSSYSQDAFIRRVEKACQGVQDAGSLGLALRQARQREMARIAWRDLAGWASLEETLEGCTSFAEAVLEKSASLLFTWRAEKSGTPQSASGAAQPLVVMGLGKLGGRELNFSSDIDLIFAFPEPGSTRGAANPVENEEFFARLCQDLIRVLSAPAPEGLVFRVDARLRPFGENGPLAMPFPAMEAYYEDQGRHWERYAWIKARLVAGDKEAGARLVRTLRPFIFRRFLDYGTFEHLREMKEKISREGLGKDLAGDVKLGPGGIREAEFIVQVMQLLRGGVSPELQTPSFYGALDAIQAGQILPKAACEDLGRAYAFLRRTENRLQEFADRQTHRLPSGDLEKAVLAASMGFDAWPAFVEALDGHRQKVSAHFQELLGPKAPGEKAENGLEHIWTGSLDAGRSFKALEAAGFMEPDKALDILRSLRESPRITVLNEHGRDLLARLMPALAAQAGKSGRPEEVLQRLCGLVDSVSRRTSYLSLILENPPILPHLARLFEASPWIAGFVSRHPVLLDELLDPRSLYDPPDKEKLAALLDRRLAHVPAQDLEAQMDHLRVFKQASTLRVAAADVTGARTLMKVSDSLSYIAEVVLARVLDLAWESLVQRHGAPDCSLDKAPCGRGFAVIAYGKLGGLELGYASDLDLVFLHAGAPGGSTAGDKPLDNATFFARIGQRVIHILSAQTSAGVLYETDMRLRPSGGQGILVSHIEAFANYQREAAWTWEHQALVRARPVAGEPALCQRFESVRRAVLTAKRDREALRKDVAGMRERMRADQQDPRADTFDLKQGPGGIVDIEFLAQYLVLAHAAERPALAIWTDNVRILETIAQEGLLPKAEAEGLTRAYLALRAQVHRLALLDEPALAPAGALQTERDLVRRIWENVLGF